MSSLNNIIVDKAYGVSPISRSKPPYYRLIKLIFPEYDFEKTTMTWGGVIYTSIDMPEALLVHELVHVRQQQGKNRWLFLLRYWLSPRFRYRMELEAFQEEWRYLRGKYPRAHEDRTRQMILDDLARHLSGPIYKNIISFEDAKKAIMGI